MIKHINIITFNRAFLLEDCIESIINVLGDSRKDYQINVFDDGSTTNETKEFLEEAKAKGSVDYYEIGNRAGVAQNSNRALRYSKRQNADIIFLLNDDIVLQKNAFAIYENALEKTDFHHFCFTDKQSPNKPFQEFILKKMQNGLQKIHCKS